MDDTWYTSYVMGFSNDMSFLMIIEKGISAMIRNRTIKVGEFYEVRIAPVPRAERRFKAQHTVTQFRPISPLAEFRLDYGMSNSTSSSPLVMLTTKARFNGYISDRYITLFNEDFGTFIDLKNLVKHTDKIVEFEFKCRVSPRDEHKSIFTPTKIIGYTDLSEEEPMPRRTSHRKVEGFVGSESKISASRFVWSKDLPDRDALLDDRFCPHGVDMAGKWIEMVVNEKSRVVEPVRIIADKYPSRVVSKIPEVEATFEYVGFYDGVNVHMFRHPIFGLISDHHCVVNNPVPQLSYTGWIIRNRLPGMESCRWKLSNKQSDIFENRSPSPGYNRCENPLEDEPPHRMNSRLDYSTRVQQNNERYYRSRSESPSETLPNRAPSTSLGSESSTSSVSTARMRSTLHDNNISSTLDSGSEHSSRARETDAEKELRTEQNKRKRIACIVTIFAQDPDIRRAMRMLDVELFDEMVELTAE